MLEHALAVAAAKAKMLGLVVAAAAIGGTAASTGALTFSPVSGETTVSPEVSASPEVTATPDVTGSPEVTASPEVTESPAVEVSPATEATPVSPTDVTPSACPEGLKNHGQYVSSVAKDKSITGREHGKAVSEAAHSDCGKKSGDDAEAADADEVEQSEAPESPEAEDADEVDADDSDSDSDEAKPAKEKKAKKSGGRGRG